MHEMRIIGLFWLLYLFHKFIPFLYKKKNVARHFILLESQASLFKCSVKSDKQKKVYK